LWACSSRACGNSPATQQAARLCRCKLQQVRARSTATSWLTRRRAIADIARAHFNVDCTADRYKMAAYAEQGTSKHTDVTHPRRRLHVVACRVLGLDAVHPALSAARAGDDSGRSSVYAETPRAASQALRERWRCRLRAPCLQRVGEGPARRRSL